MPEKNSLSGLKKQDTQRDVLPKPGAANDRGKAQPPSKAEVKPMRITKGFQVEAERAGKWDLLVAQMKNKTGEDKRTSPQLMDEAMDYIFKKYGVE